MAKKQRQAVTYPTPDMIEAGVYALQGFGSLEDFYATNPALVVRAVFEAMQNAGVQAHGKSPEAPKSPDPSVSGGA